MATSEYDKFALLMGTIADINNERRYQVVDKGFTKEKDNDQMPHQWLDYIQKYLDNAANVISANEYREQLVKVAALACAAIEAHDRTNV